MSLETLFADAGARLNFAVEISSAKRSDGTARVWKAAVLGIDNSETLPPWLTGLGPLDFSLQDDDSQAFFSGLASQSIGSVEIRDKSYTHQLDAMLDYTFSGRQCVIKVGRDTDLYSAYETYRVCIQEGEPVLGSNRAAFALQTPLARLLREPVRVARHVGIPTCIRAVTDTWRATITRIAAYDLSRYTLMLRFRRSGNPSATAALFTKLASGTDANWILQALTNGKVQFVATSGGIATTSITTAAGYCDGVWHTVVAAHDAANLAYQMVDGGDLVIDASVGSPDLSIANVTVGGTIFGGLAVGFEFSDVRLYDRYVTPDEARALSAVRSDGGGLGCIGLWRFDDNGGTNADDYSSNANHATLSGVLNTDYSWEPTDLGEPELAGTPMPLAVGVPFNAKAQLIDKDRERFRIADKDVVTGGQSEAFRSRGTDLTGGGVDWTDQGGGVYKMTSAEDEPVTYDIRGVGDEDVGYLTRVIPPLLTSRTRITSGDIDNLQMTALEFLCPWQVGYHTDQEVSGAELLSSLAATAGLHYYEDAAGDLFFNLLMPPLAMGPYGGSCLDFRGKSGFANRVEFGDIGDCSGSYTLAAWFKTHATDTALISASSPSPPTGQYLFDKGTNYSLSLALEGADAGKIVWAENATLLKTGVGLFEAGQWHFLACVRDNSGNTKKVYLGKLGSTTLTEVASASAAGGGTTNSVPLRIGYHDNGSFFWGSVGFSQVWTVAKTKAQLEALMAAPPVGNEANLAVYAPMNDGSGTTVAEKVSGGTGTILGTVGWVPRLRLDLRDTPSIKLHDVHRAAPAWKIVTRYARNWTPMSNADLDSGISQSKRLDYTRTWKDVTLLSETIRERYLHAREISLDACLTEREDAQRLARYVAYRFGTDQLMGILDFPGPSDGGALLPASRRALGLNLGDEISVRSDEYGLYSETAFRILRARLDPMAQSATLGLWGTGPRGGYAVPEMYSEDYIE